MKYVDEFRDPQLMRRQSMVLNNLGTLYLHGAETRTSERPYTISSNHSISTAVLRQSLESIIT